MKKPRISKPDFLVNVLYMLSLAMDLMLRDCLRRSEREGIVWKGEKKMLFNRFISHVHDACVLQEQLTQDIYDTDAKHSFRNVQIWQEESNELARLILLYADRATDPETVEIVHEFLLSLPSEGLCDEQLLSGYRLRKLQ